VVLVVARDGLADKFVAVVAVAALPL